MKVPFITAVLFCCFVQDVYPQEVGTELEDDLKAYLETFREARSLLGSGESRLAVSFGYQNDTSKTLIVDEINKSISIVSGFDYGVTNNLNMYGVFSYSNQSFFSESALGDTFEESDNLKSFKAGGKYAFLMENQNTPELVFDVSFQQSYLDDSEEYVGGFNLNAIKSFDPIVVVGSVGVEQWLDLRETFLNIYQGIAFGISDRVALGTDISWSTPISNSFVSAKDVAVLTERLTITFGSDVIEPSVSFGLTDFSSDLSFGLAWSRRFK